MNRESLFAIDVSSEIRSLCESQLRGTWQMPAEFVRFAVRSGAGNITVSSGWRGFSVRWKGGSIDDSTFRNLVVALDRTAAPGHRQKSISEIESSGAEVLLWAGGVAGARFRIESLTNGRWVRFTRAAGRTPQLSIPAHARVSDDVALHWRCSGLDRNRAGKWLRMACRFSDADITVDGRPVPRGFTGGLYRMRLEDPLPCTLGLTRHGEEPVLWLLRDGIVAARAAVPGYPPFEAAVELGSVISGAASSSDLRRAVRPFVSQLCERAVEMMIRVTERSSPITRPDGQRLVILLLRAARRGIRAADIFELPLIPTLGQSDGLLSLSDLERMARRCGGRSFTVEPGDGREGLLTDPSSTVVMSPDVRGLVVDLTGVRFQPPGRRRIGFLRRLADRIRRAVRRVGERLWGAIGPRIVRSDALSAREQRVLTSLRFALEPLTVEFGHAARLRRTARGIIVPRRDPAVVAAVNRCRDERIWLYPLVLALKIDAPSLGSLREGWIASIEKPADDPTFRTAVPGPRPRERR